jgi:hypothetical protein
MSTRGPNIAGPELSRRRSQRVILCVPITVNRQGGTPNASFQEDAQTLVVNAHGALIALAAKVERGQTLRLKNHQTQEELECRVVYSGAVTDGRAQVGIEFVKPSPDFWRISFPPEDWIVPDQAPAGQRSPVAQKTPVVQKIKR